MKKHLIGLIAGLCIMTTAIFAAHSGVVKETMDAAGYTYVRLETANGDVWFAGPVQKVEVGGQLTVEDGMLMSNFNSKTLGRTFEKIHFINSYSAASTGGHGGHGSDLGAKDPHANIPGYDKAMAAKSEQVVVTERDKVEKAGYTIEEMYFQPELLKGQEVSVRGIVTKYNSEIMGKNWIHISDGSGSAGNNDLILTSTTACAVGDQILVKGKVETDHDLGMGYHFDLIILDAELTVEKK
jgi:hypothetical protein